MGSGHQCGSYRIIPTESRLEAAGIRSGEDWGILDVSGSGTGGFLMDCMWVRDAEESQVKGDCGFWCEHGKEGVLHAKVGR